MPFLHQEKNFSAADHYAHSKHYKVVDCITGKVVADYCLKSKSERDKDNAEIERKHKEKYVK
jgi:hypothetical protein